MTIRTIRIRIEKLRATLTSPGNAAMAAAFIALHRATATRGGPDCEQWFHRVANGRATAADEELLAALPSDALNAAGVTGIEYVRLMHRVLTDF